MDKPEALRLADLIRSRHGNDINDEAAAELRRLHAQRDALLEACKRALEQISPNYYRTRDTIRAAIKAVEEAK